MPWWLAALIARWSDMPVHDENNIFGGEEQGWKHGDVPPNRLASNGMDVPSGRVLPVAILSSTFETGGLS